MPDTYVNDCPTLPQEKYRKASISFHDEVRQVVDWGDIFVAFDVKQEKDRV